MNSPFILNLMFHQSMINNKISMCKSISNIESKEAESNDKDNIIYPHINKSIYNTILIQDIQDIKNIRELKEQIMYNTFDIFL